MSIDFIDPFQIWKEFQVGDPCGTGFDDISVLLTSDVTDWPVDPLDPICSGGGSLIIPDANITFIRQFRTQACPPLEQQECMARVLQGVTSGFVEDCRGLPIYESPTGAWCPVRAGVWASLRTWCQDANTLAFQWNLAYDRDVIQPTWINDEPVNLLAEPP